MFSVEAALRYWIWFPGITSRFLSAMWTSAASAAAKREGAGKLRHINISSLWIQEKQDLDESERRKGLDTENPSDLMRKVLAEGRDLQVHDGEHLKNAWKEKRAEPALDVLGT